MTRRRFELRTHCLKGNCSALVFGDEKYKRACEETEAYCEKYFIDRQNGEWYGYLHYDNTVSNTLKGNIFKGPFHIPRLYMIMALLNETGDIDKYMGT